MSNLASYLSTVRKLVVRALVLTVVTVGVATAATVRGRLDRVYRNGVRKHAAGVAVTVLSRARGRTSPSHTDSDGMYYIYNVSPGAYYLEVWVNSSPGSPPMVFPIQVVEPYTNVPAIVVH